MEQSNWKKYNNILCIRLDNMGDVLMSSPAIRALKQQKENRKITLLTSHMGKKIAPYISEIDEVLEFNVPWMKLQKQDTDIIKFCNILKEKQFDAAVIFTNFSQNPLPAAFLCYLAQIPHVLSYCRENPYDLISQWIPDKAPYFEMKHQVVRDLDLVHAVGATTDNNSIRLFFSPTALQKVEHLLKSKQADLHKRLVVMHPGVSEVKRQYPPERFGAIAAELTQKGYLVIIAGTSSEKDIARKVLSVSGTDIIDLCGELTIEQYIALIQRANLLISNNTGPVHIAAAVQTPVLVFYALTNPEHLPWNVNYRAFYFNVPHKLKTQNTILSYAENLYMNKQVASPSTEGVLHAADELIQQGPVVREPTKIIKL